MGTSSGSVSIVLSETDVLTSPASLERSREKEAVQRSPVLAVVYCTPIGLLGGLMGLSGAEFRLPVLARVFGYRARQAVALDLAVSLVTVVSALVIRG